MVHRLAALTACERRDEELMHTTARRLCLFMNSQISDYVASSGWDDQPEDVHGSGRGLFRSTSSER
jgi:hypothetical protein